MVSAWNEWSLELWAPVGETVFIEILEFFWIKF